MLVFLIYCFFERALFQMFTYWNAQKTKSLENVLQYIFTIFVLFFWFSKGSTPWALPFKRHLSWLHLDSHKHSMSTHCVHLRKSFFQVDPQWSFILAIHFLRTKCKFLNKHFSFCMTSPRLLCAHSCSGTDGFCVACNKMLYQIILQSFCNSQIQQHCRRQRKGDL